MVEQWSHYIPRVRDGRPPGRRVFRILLSGVISLSIISAGTYWMLFRFEGGESGPSGNPVGAGGDIYSRLPGVARRFLEATREIGPGRGRGDR